MTTFIPAQCTERETGGWEDCTWSSGVMYANARRGWNQYPSTRAEYEGLRVDGGDGPAENPGDGSNLRQLRDGLAKRYGIGGTLTSIGTTWAEIRSRLVPGTTAVVQGSMGVWSSTSHWRRWDPPFAGAHAVHVVAVEGVTGKYWWMNPQAPNWYAGEWITEAELARYFEALRWQVFYGPVGAERTAVLDLRPFPSGERHWTVAGGTTLAGYDPQRPGGPVKVADFPSASGAMADAEVYVHYSSGEYSSWPVPKGGPFLRVTNGAFAGLLIVKAQVTLDPLPEPIPEPPPAPAPAPEPPPEPEPAPEPPPAPEPLPEPIPEPEPVPVPPAPEPEPLPAPEPLPDPPSDPEPPAPVPAPPAPEPGPWRPPHGVPDPGIEYPAPVPPRPLPHHPPHGLPDPGPIGTTKPPPDRLGRILSAIARALTLPRIRR